jgi:N-acetyl-beta-hexosaminidase
MDLLSNWKDIFNIRALQQSSSLTHIELIPYLDGPAHIAFILKHPEYAKLREFPDTNYEICATNPDSYKLLEGMYQDLLDANRGVKHFFLSTDEPYYLGLAHNSQCNETDMEKTLGSQGRIFAYFVNQAGQYLHDRGRTVIIWGEFPMKPSDLKALPPYVVNGEVYGPEFDRRRRKVVSGLLFNTAGGPPSSAREGWTRSG